MLEPTIEKLTIEKLTSLRLGTMVAALREMLSQPPKQALSFEEKHSLLVDREWQERENRKLQKRLKDAKLTKKASVENLIADPARGLERDTIRELSSCRWIEHKHNLVIVGATGTGKSYLAAALAEQAGCRGYRALLLRMKAHRGSRTPPLFARGRERLAAQHRHL